ncbi:MAG: DUF4870 domain-containing protein [Ardenticatenaceae bacterium]|nr:DUF4870 domain-containing protein [Ardenticatenaceae bacterium]HBY94063.1 hypothetical protein [Chloroflexota bacterium]
MDSGMPAPEGEISNDDRTWALLTYVLSPIVPIIVMIMEEKKNRPFLKAHNAQALVLGIIQVVLWMIAPFGLCIPALAAIAVFILQVYYGVQAYNGKYVTIPWVTDFVKQQGWA